MCLVVLVVAAIKAIGDLGSYVEAGLVLAVFIMPPVVFCAVVAQAGLLPPLDQHDLRERVRRGGHLLARTQGAASGAPAPAPGHQAGQRHADGQDQTQNGGNGIGLVRPLLYRLLGQQEGPAHQTGHDEREHDRQGYCASPSTT